MDKKTEAALRASIAHWKENVVAETPDLASVEAEYCGLCRVFDETCEGCPVKEATGQIGCSGTPYSKARKALISWRLSLISSRLAYKNGPERARMERRNWRTAAQAEVDFLESLLPNRGEKQQTEGEG